MLATRRLAETERLWRAWVQLLERLHAELKYTARPVQELIASADRQTLRPLVWLSEFDGEAPLLCCPRGLCREERAFAEVFFSFLGTSDLDGQLAHIEHCCQRARELLQTATERRGRLSGVYTVMGVCAGACAGLVMV